MPAQHLHQNQKDGNLISFNIVFKVFHKHKSHVSFTWLISTIARKADKIFVFIRNYQNLLLLFSLINNVTNPIYTKY